MIKYLKSFGYTVVSIIVLSIITCILNYFNICDSNTVNILKLFTVIISMIIGGIYVGSCTKDKGYIQGLKIGLIYDVILFIISILVFHNSFHKEMIIYYLIIIVSSILGSIIGINKKKSNN